MANLLRKNQMSLIAIYLGRNRPVKSTYDVLRVLKSFKRVKPFKTCKCLAKSLFLSRINYCNAVYGI